MKNQIRSLIVVLCVSISMNPLHAQWVASNGPQGGDVRSIVTIGNSIIAGTNGGGILRSTDNGSSWKPANNGISDQNVTAVVVKGSDVFAATSGGTVY
jgi:hypothetical protein